MNRLAKILLITKSVRTFGSALIVARPISASGGYRISANLRRHFLLKIAFV